MIALIVTAALALTDPPARSPRLAIECPAVADLGSAARNRLALDLARPLREAETDEALAPVAALFVDHGFDRAEAVNYLIAAYCPTVASDRTLNTYERTLKVQDFANRADAAVVSALQPAGTQP